MSLSYGPGRSCVICGNPLLNRQKHCCSVTCQRTHQSGPNHHAFKGVCVRTDGYLMRRYKGKPILEHRYQMEQHLGRELLPSEVVHHKDGNKQNNSIENLELLTSHSEHISRKHRKSFISETHKECSKCHEIKPRVEFYPSKHRDGSSFYCKECERASKRVPVRQEIKATSRLLTCFGETKTVTQWAHDPRCPVGPSGLFQRIYRGWPAELAITAPKGYSTGV